VVIRPLSGAFERFPAAGPRLVGEGRRTIARAAASAAAEAAAEGDTRIVGTPTTPGDYSFTLTATDASGLAVSRSFAVRVTSALTITTTTAPAGRLGSPYDLRLGASGGTLPVRWSISGGSLPAGISLDARTGAITGTPTLRERSSSRRVPPMQRIRPSRGAGVHAANRLTRHFGVTITTPTRMPSQGSRAG
jgi:hypothetical protein